MRQRRPIVWQNLGPGGEEVPLPPGEGAAHAESTRGHRRRSGPAPVPTRDEPGRPAVVFEAPQGPPSLVGCFDPLDGTVLEAGERVVVCLACGTGYHATSWDFLSAHNAGACCNCKRTSELTYVVLGTSPSGSAAVDARGAVVRLEDLRQHINLAVVFEGRVEAHQVSAATGTHFIKFHQDRNPFKGFKLVIFSSEVHRWERVGIDPASYVGQTIQVRGLLKDHPRYGLEILPKSPDSIRLAGA